MGNSGRAQGFQDGHAGGDLDGVVTEVTQPRPARSRLPQRARHAPQEKRREQRQKTDLAHECPVDHPGHHVGADPRRREQGFEPFLIRRQRANPHAGRDESGQRGGRDQNRQGEGEPLLGRVPRLEPEPHVQPDAGVHPNHKQGYRLCDPERGVGGPQEEQFQRVALIDVEDLDQHAGPQHVADQQHGYQQPKGGLRQLPRWQAQAAARVERPQARRHVDQGGAREKDRSRRGAPRFDGDRRGGLHRLQRDQPQGMVEQMADHVKQQHQPAIQTQAVADAALVHDG